MRVREAQRLERLLREVSRSFYTTLWVLPGGVRHQIGLAYLLARATDTIADTEVLPVSERAAALRAYRERILGEHQRPLDFGGLARSQASPAERVLLERTEEALALLGECTRLDQELIRDVLRTITSGQELDLTRFEGCSGVNIISLRTDPELEDYTYRVAGCVGEFWTRMCRAHLFPRAELDDAQLLGDAVLFGKGLQLVNILRDLPFDLRQGRCYLPSVRLQTLRLEPAALLRPETEPQLRPIYRDYLDRARTYLGAGWNYTNTLPRSQMRVRLACAWPILIGLRTIARLERGNVLDAGRRIKITRAEVRALMWRTVWRYPWPAGWRRLFDEARR